MWIATGGQPLPPGCAAPIVDLLTLPPGWTRYEDIDEFSPTQGKVFYHNDAQKLSQWHFPGTRPPVEQQQGSKKRAATDELPRDFRNCRER
jgi:hypothetical protein